MATKATAKAKLEHLEDEVRALRSCMIGLVGKDPEGEYRPEFVAEVLRDAKEKATYRFTTPEDFLKKIRKVNKR